VRCWQKKDADVQTSFEQLDIHPDIKQQRTASSSTHTAGLPPRTLTAVGNGVCPAEPDHQHRVHTGLDVHSSQVTEISNGSGINSDTARPLPESGQDQTPFRIIPQEHACAEIGQRNRVLPPCDHRQAKRTSPRIHPTARFHEDGNGNELSVSTRTSLEDRSHGTHMTSEASTAHHDGVSATKLPSSEAIVPSRSVDHDRGPSAGSRSRIQAETDDENKVPSRSVERNREPSADSNGEITSHSDVEKRVPSSRARVRSRSLSRDRGPSADHRTVVPTNSNNDNISHSHHERLNPQRRSRGESSRVGRISAEAEGLSPCDNADEDAAVTSAWSDDSPQHSTHRQSRLQLTQVCYRLSVLCIVTPKWRLLWPNIKMCLCYVLVA